MIHDKCNISYIYKSYMQRKPMPSVSTLQVKSTLNAGLLKGLIPSYLPCVSKPLEIHNQYGSKNTTTIHRDKTVLSN